MPAPKHCSAPFASWVGIQHSPSPRRRARSSTVAAPQHIIPATGSIALEDEAGCEGRFRVFSPWLGWANSSSICSASSLLALRLVLHIGPKLACPSLTHGSDQRVKGIDFHPTEPWILSMCACGPPSQGPQGADAHCEQQRSTVAMSTSGRTRLSRLSRPSSSPMSRSVPVALLLGRTGLSAGRMICMWTIAVARVRWQTAAGLTRASQPDPSLQLQHEREDYFL